MLSISVYKPGCDTPSGCVSCKHRRSLFRIKTRCGDVYVLVTDSGNLVFTVKISELLRKGRRALGRQEILYGDWKRLAKPKRRFHVDVRSLSAFRLFDDSVVCVSRD